MDKFPLFLKMKQLFYIPIEVPINEFFKKTKIDWQLVTTIPSTAKLFYSSKSGSKYYIEKNIIYRISKHWGHIGTCCWNLYKPNGTKKHGRKYNRKAGLGLTWLTGKEHIGMCKINDVKYLAPIAPSRYIFNEKGFKIINPEFKEYIKIYKSIK